MTPRTIGELIVQARLARGWRQIRLAEALPVPQTTLSAWERGINDIDRAAFNAIADLLEIPTDDRALAWRLPVRLSEPAEAAVVEVAA